LTIMHKPTVLQVLVSNKRKLYVINFFYAVTNNTLSAFRIFNKIKFILSVNM
jgi:hypothetical protein